MPTGECPADQPTRSEVNRAAAIKWRGAPPGIPPVLAEEFMAKLNSGSTVRKLTGGGKSGPAVVSYDRFTKHCELHPEWAAEALRISKINSINGKGLRLRSLTHCVYGHPLSGENLYVAPREQKRKCRACRQRRQDSPLPPSEQQIKRATAIFNAGGTVSQVCWGRVDGKKVTKPILTFPKLKLYRQKNPDFNRFVLSATADNNSKGQQRRYNAARARARIVRAETNDFHTIVGMAPAYLPSDVRDDIAQSILLALLDGSLRRDQVKGRVHQFVTGHNRMFPTKFAKFGDSPLVSLDEVLFDDGSTTRGDTVTRGLWD